MLLSDFLQHHIEVGLGHNLFDRDEYDSSPSMDILVANLYHQLYQSSDSEDDDLYYL